jgi:Uma2 family endonuclease
MSWDEFLDWVPDGAHAEWVEGRGMIRVTTSERHVGVLLLLTRLVATYVDLFRLGRVFAPPFLMRLPSRPSGREPDLLVVLHENLHRVRRLWLEGPADFVVEGLSETSAEIDLGEKLREYGDAGVPEYLALETRDEQNDTMLYRLDADRVLRPVPPDERGRFHSEVLPGFWIDPAWFRQDPLPDHHDLLYAIAGSTYDEWLAAKRRTWLAGQGTE